MNPKIYPMQRVLELACAAQRINGSYLKVQEPVFADDGVYMFTKHANKTLMLCTLDHRYWTADPKDAPMPLRVLTEDIDFAVEIVKYYKRLMFAAIDGENEFLTKINSLLNADTIKENEFGWVACLPSVQTRDIKFLKVKKAAYQADSGFLGNPDEWLTDLDCEIIDITKSKNYEGWNICAIIDNKMASWMSRKELKQGPAVIIKAKVKDNSKHWKYQNDETRLNYVKATQ